MAVTVVVVDVEMTVDLVLGIHVDVHLDLRVLPSTRRFFRAGFRLHLVVSGRFHVVTGNYIWVLGAMIHRCVVVVGRSIIRGRGRGHRVSARLHHHHAGALSLGRRDLRHRRPRPPFPLYTTARDYSACSFRQAASRPRRELRVKGSDFLAQHARGMVSSGNDPQGRVGRDPLCFDVDVDEVYSTYSTKAPHSNKW